MIPLKKIYATMAGILFGLAAFGATANVSISNLIFTPAATNISVGEIGRAHV